MWTVDGFLFHLDSTVFSVFLILQVGLDPLQLVLMGTILEVSYLLFEVPTGIVADTVSRKWSIVIGYVGTGIAFVMLGSARLVPGRSPLTGPLGRVGDVREWRGRGLAHR